MNNKDINALVEGRLSDEKKAEVVKWLLKNPKQQQRYHVLKARHVAKLLKEGEGKNKLDTKRKFADWYKYVGYAACVLLMVALAYTLVSPNEQLEEKYSQTILASTSIGENKTITLSDGTKVTLNANTTFSYPEKFSEESRDVSLQGEAFFDVAHNPEKPFKVATGNGMNIQVLGTVFNVKSYPEDQNVETTLVSGKVKVVEEQNQKTVVLAPSQRATYVKDADKLIVDNVQTTKFTAWREGKLIYDETPIRQVISDLKRKYKVDISVESPGIMDYKYTGEFDNLGIEQILDLFEVSSPILYKMHNNQITLFMKQ
ncbi:FecR family protein [Flagellimonas abyssi]|uniref:FecR domain-containing protein n=1 Tax=Flagellimonas abyssi TaxID=2864871 RepID=A0ABS7EQJ8_9FLAO|nr:FecR domain-containing protein [Allomuricauda abyssi]MBW8199869.1 FecR domain-containing protein [Allomuricauda abyssi]